MSLPSSKQKKSKKLNLNGSSSESEYLKESPVSIMRRMEAESMGQSIRRPE
jgi:hypothetical protein